jgi:hypothetical protein
MSSRNALLVCGIIIALVGAAAAQAPSENAQQLGARVDKTEKTAEEADNRATRDERRMNDLEQNLDAAQRGAATTGAVSILFGAFCALWAQNTRRNAWLWFFLGLIFSVITVLVLLYKNSNDPKAGVHAGY